ncbi:MAG TPA: hypothetical protein VMT46_14660 [Anaerolineaceae bacterium]|nr:hypothetical protein [Anaerolineaceae bacterium]
MSVYPWVVLIHVISAFGFVMAHGVSVVVLFRLQGERDRERICTLLELSRATLNPMYITLILVLITGIAGGFLAKWWRMGWIWLALAVFFALSFVMGRYGRAYFETLRSALGIAAPNQSENRAPIPVTAETPEQLRTLIASGHSRLLAWSGLGGLAVILLLMLMKPF